MTQTQDIYARIKGYVRKFMDNFHITNKSNIGIFTKGYNKRREDYIPDLVDKIVSKHTREQLSSIVVPEYSRAGYFEVTGDNLPTAYAIKTSLRNIRELISPGSGNYKALGQKKSSEEALNELVRQTFDGVYAQAYLSLHGGYTISGNSNKNDIKEYAFGNTVNLLAKVPDFIEWHRWNVFAHLKDPAVWSSDILNFSGADYNKIEDLRFSDVINKALKESDTEVYTSFLNEHNLGSAYPLLLALVNKTYDGPKALLNHYIANQLANPDKIFSDLLASPVYLMPTIIHEINREKGFDAHPEARVGWGNFFDHVRDIIGQTGVIGNYNSFLGTGIVLGGHTNKTKKRHPQLEDFISIGTDTAFFGPIHIGSYSRFGVHSYIIGDIIFEGNNTIGNGVEICSYFPNNNGKSQGRPGKIRLGRNVSVGDGTTIINTAPEDLYIPSEFNIPTASYVVGEEGRPKIAYSNYEIKKTIEDIVKGLSDFNSKVN